MIACNANVPERLRGGLRGAVSCHLGNGCSATASLDGAAVRRWRFTPLDGRMMSAAQIEHVLNHEAGLNGVSGKSEAMDSVLAIDGSSPT